MEQSDFCSHERTFLNHKFVLPRIAMQLGRPKMTGRAVGEECLQRLNAVDLRRELAPVPERPSGATQEIIGPADAKSPWLSMWRRQVSL